MSKRNKPHARARARAIRALEMYVEGRTDAQIAAALSYASESGARMARQRELNRRSVAAAGEMRKVHGERLLTLLRSCWGAATGGNTDAIRTAARLLDSIAKLHGLDAAQRVAIEGISSQEFARQAVELIEVINGVEGPGSRAARVLADAPGVAAALPPGVRADLFVAEPVDPEPDLEWSNIGLDIDVEDIEAQAVAEPAAVVAERPVDDGQADDGEVVEVIAELVDEPGRGCGCGDPLPAGQRRIRSGEIISPDGVPYSRTGLASRLGSGCGLAGYVPGGR